MAEEKPHGLLFGLVTAFFVERKWSLPENPPTAHNLFPTMATATLVRHVVIVGPGVHTFSKGSKTSVEHSEWVPSLPPTNISFPEKNRASML
jgi:hypothetical protein